MPENDYAIERRSHMLAERLSRKVQVIRNAIAPEGQRLPFTEQLSKADALQWWQQHRHDDLGQQVLANIKPEQVLELDKALSDSHSQSIQDANNPIKEG